MVPRQKNCPPACGPSRPFAAGFTFVELLIVLLLLGITALLAWPTLDSVVGDSRLSGATEEVVNALQYAQLRAMTSGDKTKVIIGSTDGRIVVRQYKANVDLFGGGDQLVAVDVETGSYELVQYPLRKGTNYNFRLKDDDRFKGVEISTSDFPADDPLYFDTLGAPSKGGSATLAFGGRQMVVTLDSLTGKVTVSN
jgi:prepilin-type N-terminal cleavage/methylation domain-containing protein